jgi:hypothetical protein
MTIILLEYRDFFKYYNIELAILWQYNNETAILYYYYYYYILRLSAKRYEELLAIRLRKPFMDKNPRRPSFAPFLCSPLLVYNS